MKRSLRGFSRGIASLETVIASKRPSLPGIAIFLVPMVAVSTLLLRRPYPEIKPWETSLRTLWNSFSRLGINFWIDAAFLYVCWPTGGFLTYMLGLSFRSKTSLLKKVQIVGKVWALFLLAYSLCIITTMLFAILGWNGFAHAWYVLWGYLILGGSILLILPAASRVLYGAEAQWACSKMLVMSFLMLILVLALASIVLVLLIKP